MMNGQNKVKSHGKIIAGVVIIAMLLCSCIPAITVWNDGFESSADAGESGVKGNLKYVSLGDSMVNGFGTSSYYPSEGVNVHGLNHLVADTFPSRLSTYLTGLGYTVDTVQLGVSSCRSTDFRAILDPTFVGDSHAQWMLGKAPAYAVELPTEYPRTIEGVRDFYKDSISSADIITYEFHYDFSCTLADMIMDIVDGDDIGEINVPLDIYVDEEYLELFNDAYAKIKTFVLEQLDEQGIEVSLYSDLIKFAEKIAQGMAYAVIGYCSNFDANLETIFEWNNDVKVLVLDSYNTFSGRYMTYGDYRIPLGDIMQILFDVSNLYTKWLSPYSPYVYHVDIDEVPTLMTDEFIKEGADSGNILADSKNVIMSIIAGRYNNPEDGASVVSDNVSFDIPFGNGKITLSGDCVSLYDKIDKNGDLTKLLGSVLSVTDLDWDYFTGGDFDAKSVQSVTKFMTAFGYTAVANLDNTGMMDVEVITSTEGVTVSLTYPIGEGVYHTDVVSMTKNEMAMVWMDIYLYELSAAASHPTVSEDNSGHDYVFSQLKNVIEERNVLTDDRTCYIKEILGIIDTVKDIIDGPYNPDYQEPVLTPGTDVPSNNTIVSLCDQSASMGDNSYPAILEEMLGLKLDDTKLPSLTIPGYITLGPRIDDINYILGGTNVTDGYGKLIMTNADFKKIKDSVATADVVILQAGIYNALFPVLQTYMQEENIQISLPFNVTDLEIIDKEFCADVMKLIGQIEDLAVKMFGQDIISTIKTINTAIESTVYSIAGFIENYPEAVAAIYNLNSDADIVILGINNFLDGFYVPIDDKGTEIDLGFFGEIIAGAMNCALENMIPEADNIHFVDIPDVESKASAAGEIDIKALIESIEDPLEILSILDLCAPSDNGQQQIADAIEEIFTDRTYSITYNWTVDGKEYYETVNLEYGSTIPEFVPELTAGYSFVGWDEKVPATMPAKDLVLNGNIEKVDVKLVMEIEDNGDVTITIVGLEGTYSEGTLYVSYAYGSVDETGYYDSGSEDFKGVTIENTDGSTYCKYTVKFSAMEETIQSVWASYVIDGSTTVNTPHILYKNTEVFA